MENSAHCQYKDWGCYDCSTRSPSESPAFSATTSSTSSSSNTEIDIGEDTDWINPPYETNHRLPVGLEAGELTKSGSSDVPSRQCQLPQCMGVSFRSEKELKRHEKMHDPDAIQWYCGCCRNLERDEKGKTRKDKVQDHIRNVHQKSKFADKKSTSIECPVKDCHTLVNASSCLDLHLTKCHPDRIQDTTARSINGSICDCNRYSEVAILPSVHGSQAHKHWAEPPLRPTTKRGKHDLAPSQPSAFSLQGNGHSELSTANMWTSLAVDENIIQDAHLAFNDLAGLQSDFSLYPTYSFNPMGYDTGIDGNTWPYQGESCLHQELSMSYPFPNPAPTTQTIYPAVHQIAIEESRVVDFLAIWNIQDHAKWAPNIQNANNVHLGVDISSITYNPKKETVTLRGSSKEAVEQMMKVLQKWLTAYSEHRGRNYLKKTLSYPQSEPSKHPACTLRSSNERISGFSEQQRTFPIKANENRRLVAVWFKHILPALPKILSPRLGGTYASSLVRQGQVDIRAEPCIEIESPCIPGAKARRIISDLLNDVCAKANHEPLRIRFRQGRVKKLSRGGKDEEDEDIAQEDEANQRLRFNMIRPYSKARMGASLGLLHSKRISATLGGYVHIDGDKYMLTSDHFITESQKRENNDGDEDLESLISPSRSDLSWQENSLKQVLRDSGSELERQVQRIHGDRDVLIGDLCYQLDVAPEATSTMAMENINLLLDQVTKAPDEYTVGSVFRRSQGPRAAPAPQSIADILRLENGQDWLHHMDWSLCKLREGSEDVCENRHKYRSDSDARSDDYIEEQDQKYQPGDICCQTCSVKSGDEVYYVGQGSGYRSGTVDLPCLVSRESVETYDWGITNADGLRLPLFDVEGDSGAWVIRRQGNQVMGQVHSFSSGRVLFTPIDIIFDDISKACGVDVSLPPHSLDQTPGPEVFSLCSTSPRPARPLKFLLKDLPKLRTPPTGISPLKSPIVRTQFVGKTDPQAIVVNSEDETSSSSSCDSPLSFSNLTDIPQFANSSSESLSSSQQPRTPDLSSDRCEKLWPTSLPDVVSEARTSESPYWRAGESHEPHESETMSPKFGLQPPFQDKLSVATHSLSWPTKESGVVKARWGFDIRRLQPSREHQLATILSIHLNRVAAGRRKNAQHHQKMPSFFKRRLKKLPELEATSRLVERSVLESCKAATEQEVNGSFFEATIASIKA